VGRRRLLAGAAGAALAGTLAACGSDNGSGGQAPSDTGQPSGGSNAPGSSQQPTGSSTSNGSSGSSSSNVPAYAPYIGVTPDVPAGDNGVPAGFVHYPANPPQFVTGPVGNGSDVRIMIEGVSHPATPHGNNQWWQALEKAWNVKLTFDNAAGTEYTAKLQAAIAGDQLGDLTQIPPIPDQINVLQKMFVDLTPYLGGDAIKAYPGLAALPTSAWTKVATINGKIWGIPQPRPRGGTIFCYQNAVMDKLKLAIKPTSGQEFIDMLKSATDAAHSRWAFGQVPTSWLMSPILEMMEAPNNWAVADGKFTSMYESDQMPDALNAAITIWKDGSIFPDAFSAAPTEISTKWKGGSIVFYDQNYFAPGGTWDIIRLPKWDGGGYAKKHLSKPGYGDPVGFAHTADEKRVQELLRICDYIASPFGTKEYLLVNYGVKDHDYTLQGSDPVTTDTYSNEYVVPSYAGSATYVNIYVPGKKDLVTADQQYLADILPTGVDDPTWGLYSPTNATKGAAAVKKLGDVQADIIQGRKKVSDWAGAVSTWRKEGGDAMRSEYEEAYAKANS
jgi:putative aldouronate transport system substrate-binding protein